MGMVERLIRNLKSQLAIMKIDKPNKPYKLASDVAELIKTLRITPNANKETTPFDAHFGRKASTPLSNLSTSPKLSNLSCKNTKLPCLDEKVLSKPALTAEAMWNRETNSEDELDLNYKVQNRHTRAHFQPSTTRCTGINTQQNTSDTRQCTTNNRGKQRAKDQPNAMTKTDTITLENSDEEFDRLLLKKFPVGSHILLSKNWKSHF